MEVSYGGPCGILFCIFFFLLLLLFLFLFLFASLLLFLRFLPLSVALSIGTLGYRYPPAPPSPSSLSMHTWMKVVVEVVVEGPPPRTDRSPVDPAHTTALVRDGPYMAKATTTTTKKKKNKRRRQRWAKENVMDHWSSWEGEWKEKSTKTTASLEYT